MAIDKLIPRFLVSDEDERLLKEGAMTDALNVTISENGEGSEGVIKNLKGTLEAKLKLGLSQGDIGYTSTVKVIGSVSDPQLSAIYFFVSGGGDQEDAIYKYDTTDDKYLPVFKSSAILNFNDDLFVKADVVNGDFDQDGQTETALYFTDGLNPPRKINVDRAMAGEYPTANTSIAKRAICCAKRPNQFPPTYRFDSDANFPQNNFKEDIFQFATQNVYVDGEESALSPYSSVAVSQPVILNALETDGYAVSDILDNVCVVSLNANSTEVGLDFVRLLCRKGNDGAFFIIDEVKPSESLTKDIFGTSTQVYSPLTGEYKFYNTVLGSFIPERVSTKLYDNVPQTATGQAITGGRLFYSDYEEGRENIDTNVDLAVNYSGVIGEGSSLIPDTEVASVITQTGTKDIQIDLIGGDAFDGLESGGSSASYSSVLPAGSSVSIGFSFEPSLSIGGQAFLALPAYGTDGNNPLNPFDGNTANGFVFINFAYFDKISTQGSVSVSFTASVDTSLENVAENLADEFVSQEVKVSYNLEESSSSPFAPIFIASAEIQNLASPGSNVSGYLQYNGFEATWRFAASVDETTHVITVSPYIDSLTWLNPYTSGTIGGDGVFVMNEGTSDGITVYLTPGALGSNLLSSSGVTYGNVSTAYISSLIATAKTTEAVPTFKSGSSHSFGLVYRDEFGRSGAVNEIGSVYVKTITERANANPAQPLGPASVTLTFSHDPPEWATDYQVVYSGPDSMQDYVQYTTGPAYAAMTRVPFQNDNTQTLTDPENRRIYLSLNTLDLYRKEKNASRDYVFTKGDRLRVVSRISDNNSTTEYPLATDGSLIEFEVVDLINISHGSGPETTPVNINYDASHNSASSRPDEHEGLFIVLESSKINGGLTDSTGAPVRYVGYDWGDISGYDPSDATLTGDLERTNTVNHWGKGTVVEIYTPKKSTDVKVYYEIGHGRRIGPGRVNVNDNYHGVSLNLINGSAWMRPVACKTPLHVDDIEDGIQVSNTAWANRPAIDTYGYKTLVLESSNVTDRFDSEIWSKGRAHLVNRKADTVRRTNSVTYSDLYQEDILLLSFSSFNLSELNYKNFDPKFGKISYIGNYNDDMVLLQENKLCLVPVNKNIIEYASGNADVTVSNLVLGQQRYSSGDYGVGSHPESVLIQDNDVFFVDKSRQAVMRLGGGQLVPISQKGVSSLFEDFFNADNSKYVSGYDPRDNVYYITSLGNNPETFAYDVYRGVWQSKCSFTPDLYANQNNMMYSAFYVNTSTDTEITNEHYMFWKHDSDTYNTFYGDNYPSTVEVVSKLSPSNVKVFNAISYEGDSADWDMDPGAVTDLGQTSGTITSWSEREGSYYSAMPKDSSPKYVYAGSVVSASGSTITLTNSPRFNRLPFNIAEHPLVFGSAHALVSDTADNSKVDSSANNSLTIVGTLESISPNTNIYFKVDDDGDAMRGHWAKITLTNNSTAKNELYCINAHVSDSKSHHPLGQ